MTEAEYRLLPYDSYSSLKDFVDDRKKYYKKWVAKEEVQEELSKSLVMGSMVDTLLYSPSEFDKKFILTTTQAPTGQMGEFVSNLYRRSVECIEGSEPILTRSIEVVMKEAYNDVKYNRAGDVVAFKRKTFDQVVEDFTGSEAELYYRQLLNSIGKSVVELYEIQSAERLVNELKNNWVTKEIVNRKSDKDVDIYEQLIIIFEYKGYKLKSMLDKAIVDHRRKMIFIYDLKTCWDNEKEFQSNWFKYKYYLQAATYYLAILHWAEKEGWGNYQIIPMQFIVADTTNHQNPLIYQTDAVNLQQGLEGFTLRGKYYLGVDRAITDLKWHRETNIWDISPENYENKGLVKIKPFTEDEY